MIYADLGAMRMSYMTIVMLSDEGVNVLLLSFLLQDDSNC